MAKLDILMRFRLRLTLVAAGIFLPFLALEISARLIKGKPVTYLVNFVDARQTLLRSVYPADYDSELGWIPRKGMYGDLNYWGKTITILDNGIRHNGVSAEPRNDTVVLAVGDSFTFGDQVSDDETWPAQLEKLSRYRILNGGVFGYGLDQTVIRAEKLVALVDPSLLVISFIPEDISRTELSVRSGASKPFFEVVDGNLDLRNVPVPVIKKDIDRLGLFRNVFGYSFLIDGIMRKLGHEAFWYGGGWDTTRVHTEGVQVSCLLMERLSFLARARGLDLLLLAQYLEHEVSGTRPSIMDPVIKCARQYGIAVLDLHKHLGEIWDASPETLGSLYFHQSHMTPAGNYVVAQILCEYFVGNGSFSDLAGSCCHSSQDYDDNQCPDISEAFGNLSFSHPARQDHISGYHSVL